MEIYLEKMHVVSAEGRDELGDEEWFRRFGFYQGYNAAVDKANAILGQSHYHEALYEDGQLTEDCKKCGRNIRDISHKTKIG